MVDIIATAAQKRKLDGYKDLDQVDLMEKVSIEQWNKLSEKNKALYIS